MRLICFFFPKLLSGPIERAHNFLPQLREKHTFNYTQVVGGLKRILWGLFLKLVIANRLAIPTENVFNNYEQYTGVVLLLASIFFTIQLFADFAGYTEIAIGSAQILGFRLMENFKSPFIAKSVTEFWRRWHISLTTWVNDYIYNTIVINHREWNKWGIVYAGMVTFLILGFWHGASWNYLIFGFLQGLALAIEFLSRKLRKRIRSIIPVWLNTTLGISITFGYFSFSSIFFKAIDLQSALFISSHIITIIPDTIYDLINHKTIIKYFGVGKKDLIFSALLIISLWVIQFVQSKYNISEILRQKPGYIRWIAYYAVLLIILFLGVFENRQFIYFQF